MKKLLFIALAIMMVGCEHEYRETPKKITHDRYTYVIDSCEYIKGINEYTHKGNCKYCQERRKQEMRELIKELGELKSE